MDSEPESRRLTQQDAFFVAYQEASGAAMSLGAELELTGELTAEQLEGVMEKLVGIWPRLGSKARRRSFGLAWQGGSPLLEMLTEARQDGDFERWRNAPIDPFREPSFQLLWQVAGGGTRLAFRAHHAGLDGHALATVGGRALQILAGAEAGAGPGAARPPARRPGAFGRLLPMWRYLRFLQRESRRDGSARLAIASPAAGDIAVKTRQLPADRRSRLERWGRAYGLGLPWLACAAFIKAIGGFNDRRGGDPRPVSLELPVSTRRRGAGAGADLGNGISPLLLRAAAGRPLLEIARELNGQFAGGVRLRAHLAVPFFTAGGRFLPWWLFRRLAADTTYSGFATSHFTWMRPTLDPFALEKLSEGRLGLRKIEFYGPVCLHMGAALQGLETPSACQLSLTYRLNALSAAAAEELLEGVFAELDRGAG
jgi:hypothetical protein